MEQEVALPKSIKLVFAFLVFISGVALYFYWAASYSAWTDIGLYSVVVVLMGFGLSGIYLYTRKEVE
jgi:hypothetical protein